MRRNHSTICVFILAAQRIVSRVLFAAAAAAKAQYQIINPRNASMNTDVGKESAESHGHRARQRVVSLTNHKTR